MKAKKLKIEDFVTVIHWGPEGWESIYRNGTWNIPFRMPDKTGFQKYLRGLRAALRQCYEIGFTDVAATSYVKGSFDAESFVRSKFKSVLNQLSQEQILKLAEGKRFQCESYINGTFGIGI
jgi:hypothetical protein